MSSIMLERSSNVKENLWGFRRKFIRPIDFPPLKPYPSPPQEQPMAGDIMTTGVGFLCSDGIVLAAESQLTSSIKVTGKKLFEITVSPVIDVCIAGAGNVSLINKAVQLIGKNLIHGSEITADGVEEILESALDTIYTKYIDSFHGTEPDRPSLALLVGLRSPGELALWVTEIRNAMRVTDYAVIGTGGMLAQYIVETLRGFEAYVPQTKLVALYALKMAKKYDLYSGGETHLKILHMNGPIETISPDEISDTENFFDDLFSGIQLLLLGLSEQDLTEHEVLEYPNFADAIAKFKRREQTRKEKQQKIDEVMRKQRPK